MKFTKVEKSWIAYDWANSVYSIIMVSAIFPIYFTSAAATAGQSGDFWWGIGTSIATGMIALFSPILGALADYHGYKKKFFSACLGLGLIFTLFCAFVSSWQMMLLGYIISHIGYSGANLFYDGFLTDVTTNENMDKVSTWGFGMGYIGGSTIPFLISIALVSFGESIGIDGTLAVKISILITVAWWFIFSIPLLKNVKQMHGVDVPPSKLIGSTMTSLKNTLTEIYKNKGILFFLLAYFFYIDGVNTVINMATAYGVTLGLDSTGLILALLVTQLVAFPFAIIFGILAKKFGSLRLITTAVIIYFGICITGFYMGYGIEEGFLTIAQATTIFWMLSFMVGTVQGGIQALSRSFYGKMIPKKKANEYFGIYDIFGKFAAILGPMIYATVKGTTGRSSFAILAIIILFAMGAIFLFLGRKHFSKLNNV